MHIKLQKRKTYKHNPKVSPFGIDLVKKRQIKLGDAGTIDGFGLMFEYQINKEEKRMDKNNCKSKILYKCTANTSTIWQHNYAAPTAN